MNITMVSIYSDGQSAEYVRLLIPKLEGLRPQIPHQRVIESAMRMVDGREWNELFLKRTRFVSRGIG